MDFDPETGKELIHVDQKLVEKFKPHQVKGVRFLWDACFGTLEEIDKGEGGGCILAHCMGLGKTLQVTCYLNVGKHFSSFLKFNFFLFVGCLIRVYLIALRENKGENSFNSLAFFHIIKLES